MMEIKIGNLTNGLYKLATSTFTPGQENSGSTAASHTCQLKTSINKWHWRLGHPSVTVLSHIPSISVPKASVLADCEVCHFSKQHRLPFLIRYSRSTHIFDVINCDVWGPYRHVTHGTCNKFLTIVDDFSKCTWVFLLSSKSQVSQLIQDFIAYVHTQFHITMEVSLLTLIFTTI